MAARSRASPQRECQRARAPGRQLTGAWSYVKWSAINWPSNSDSSPSGAAAGRSVKISSGEFLVAEGFWKSNPLRWMRGPKVDQRRHLPTRVGREDQQAIWEAAQKRPQEPGICFERCLGQLYARQSPSLERHGLDQLHQRRRERAARNLGQLCARHLGGGNVRGDPPLLHH